jgi:heme exporter protein D
MYGIFDKGMGGYVMFVWCSLVLPITIRDGHLHVAVKRRDLHVSFHSH